VEIARTRPRTDAERMVPPCMEAIGTDMGRVRACGGGMPWIR
jgi:hypothetical protein